MNVVQTGLPGYVSEGTIRGHFNPLKYPIGPYCLLRQAPCLKPFSEWPKSFPLALLALFIKVAYRINPCLFLFHYTLCLALY